MGGRGVPPSLYTREKSMKGIYHRLPFKRIPRRTTPGGGANTTPGERDILGSPGKTVRGEFRRGEGERETWT